MGNINGITHVHCEKKQRRNGSNIGVDVCIVAGPVAGPVVCTLVGAPVGTGVGPVVGTVVHTAVGKT